MYSVIVKLGRILVYLSATHMPTIILGDSMIIYNSSIVSLMSNNDITQLVTSQATAKGTLIVLQLAEYLSMSQLLTCLP